MLGILGLRSFATVYFAFVSSRCETLQCWIEIDVVEQVPSVHH